MKRWHVVLSLATAGVVPVLANAQVRAFPEAEGFADGATGGRGGSIFHVTNLFNSGTGSFRDAVSQPNRIVVFDVGGYINLTSSVAVQSNITIAGQTAPGDGIGITGAEVSFGSKSNIICRYVRFRPGDGASSNDNGVNFYQSTNAILDHCSVQFASWNNIDAVNSNNISVQNSIISDPIGQQFGAHSEGGGQYSWSNNLWVNGHNRQPLAKGMTVYKNNVVYNYQAAYTVADTDGHYSHDIISNYFITGPATSSNGNDFYQMNANQSVYSSGNMRDSNLDGTLNGSTTVPDGGGTVLAAPWGPDTRDLPTLSASGAFGYVTAHAGASLHRDEVDTLSVSQVLTLGNGSTGTGVGSAGPGGGLYTHQSQTGLSNGGFGTLVGATRATDSDNDGIPDTWETAHGLNTALATDALLYNPLGFQMVEQYFNELGDVNLSRTWSASSGSWATAANWTGSSTPGAYDKALIRGNGIASGSVSIASGTITALSVSIGGNGPVAGEKVTVSGGKLDIYDTITVGDQNNAILQLSGGVIQAYNIVLGNTVYSPSATNYTGTFNMTGGTLQIAQLVKGAGTPGNWNAGGTLNWSGGTIQPFAAFNINVPVALSSTGGTFDSNGFDGTMSSIVSGAIGLTKIGAGTLTLSGSNTYTGKTTVSGGTLAVTNIANGGLASSLGMSAKDPANLVLDGATLAFAVSGGTDRGLQITPNGATIYAAGTTYSFSGDIQSIGAGDRTLTAYAGTSSSGFYGDIKDTTDSAGGKTTFTKDGVGRVIFDTVSKTYSGDTNILAGTLLLYTKSNLLPYGAGKGNVNISSGATLEARQSQSINGLSGAGVLANYTSSLRTIVLGNGDASGNFSGVISSPFNIIKVGTGTQIFSGTNTYTGTTAISTGILQFNQIASIGGTGASVTIAGGAIAAAGYAMDQSFLARIAPASTGSVALAISSANNLDVSSATGANLANVAIGATVNSTYTGLLKPYTNTYRLGGGTATLTFPNTNALTGATFVNVVPGGVIAVTGSNNYTGTTTISGILAPSILTTGGTASSIGISASDASNLILDGGTLRYIGAAGSTDRLFTITANGGTIESSGSGGFGFTSAGSVVASGTGDRTLTLGGTHYNANGNDSFSLQIADPTSGKTSLMKTGSGRWFFQGTPKTYSGDTTITAGDLYTNVANVLPYGTGKGNVVVNGGRLYLYSGNLNINGLSGSGGAIGSPGSRTLTLGNNNATASYAGNVADSISLVKTGTGTQTLTASNAYSGATTVSQGILRIDGSISNSSLTTVNNTGTLQVGASQTIKSLTINTGGKASILPNGKKNLKLTTLTTTGTGTLDITNNSAIITGTSESDVRTMITSGFHGGDWLGTGITSSNAANDNDGVTAVGYANNNDLGASDYNGVPLGATDTIVKYTYYGDADLSGTVTLEDFTQFLVGYQQGGTPNWINGDFDYSGTVTLEDFSLFLAGYQGPNTPLTPSLALALSADAPHSAPLAESISIVPEPTSLGLLAVGAMGLLRRRRKFKIY